MSLSLPLPFPLPFIKQEGESRLHQDPFTIHHSPRLFQFLENPVLSTCWLLHAWLPLPVRLTSAPPHLSVSPPPRSFPGLRICSRYTQCSHAHIALGQNPQAHWLPGCAFTPNSQHPSLFIDRLPSSGPSGAQCLLWASGVTCLSQLRLPLSPLSSCPSRAWKPG